MKRTPDTLNNLKFVLNSIATIKHMQLDVELRIFDLQERYRTLKMYDIEVKKFKTDGGIYFFILSIMPVDDLIFKNFLV